MIWRSARTFYSEVFGYTYEPVEEGTPYDTVSLNGQPVCGIGEYRAGRTGHPAALANLLRGGRCGRDLRQGQRARRPVVAEPWATPFGKMAAVSGPDDEVFLLNEGAPQTDYA